MARIFPKLDTLPEAQQELWPLLKEVPEDFVLYGGTAIALRFGHRESIDFDFFSSKFDNDVKKSTESLSFIQKFAVDAEQQEAPSGSQVIYVLRMSNREKVEVTFVRDEKWLSGSINTPDKALDNRIKIASPLDLMATKINALKDRRSVKDFIDISTLIEKNVSFSRGFAGAMALNKEYLPLEISTYAFLKEGLCEPDYIAEAFEKDTFAAEKFRKKLPEVINTITKEAQKLSIEKMLKLKFNIDRDLAREGRERGCER